MRISFNEHILIVLNSKVLLMTIIQLRMIPTLTVRVNYTANVKFAPNNFLRKSYRSFLVNFGINFIWFNKPKTTLVALYRTPQVCPRFTSKPFQNSPHLVAPYSEEVCYSFEVLDCRSLDLSRQAYRNRHQIV